MAVGLFADSYENEIRENIPFQLSVVVYELLMPLLLPLLVVLVVLLLAI